jgi:DNA mismatch repair protein MutS
MTVIEDYIENQNKYKKEYGKRTIFLMEVGSFFEYYGIINVPEGKTEDDMTEEEKIQNRWGAIWDVASDGVLKMSISRRGNWKFKPFMAGFPNHSIDKHLDKLLSCSYTVVIMKQKSYDTNSPERYIEGIYSPGINTSNLTYESNYLACIYIDTFKFYSTGRVGLSLGISFIDVSTGENKLYETTSKNNDILRSIDEIYRLIQSHNPHEVLLYVPESVMKDNIDECVTLNAENKLCKKFIISSFELYKTTYHFKEQLSKHSNKDYQTEVLNKIFENNTNMSIFEYLDITYYEVSLKAYVGMLEFAYHHSEEFSKRVHKPNVITDTNKLILNYNSIQQLEIIADKNKTSQLNSKHDSLLSILNKCKTSMGKRLFKERLCHPITDSKELNRRYSQVDFFRQTFTLTDELENKTITKHKSRQYEPYLMNINDLERANRKMTMGRLHPNTFTGLHRSYMNVHSILNNMEKESILFFNKDTISKFKQFTDEYQTIFDLQSIGNIYRDKVTRSIFKTGVYEDIDKLQNRINDHHMAFQKVAKTFTKYISDPRNTKGNGDYLVKIERTESDGKFISCTKRRSLLLKHGLQKAGNKPLVIKVSDSMTLELNPLEIEYKHKSSKTRIKVHGLDNMAYSLISLEERMHRKCMDHFKSCIIDFISENKYKHTLEDIATGIALLDVNISAAKASILYNYCRPSIAKDENCATSYINATKVRHPIIERINDEYEYIPNDVNFSQDNVSGMLLYGCNMCGKSSYMKSVGLNVIMAQAGFYTAAETFEYFPYEYIFTRISGNDNLFENQSSFAVEMLELRNIFKRCNDRSLVLGDELCRGTESVSGKAIVAAGICKLRATNSQFILATHLHGLDSIYEVKELPNVKAYHLSVEYCRTTERLIYDRHMKEGSGSSLYGLEVCKAMDMDADFLEIANRIRKREAGESETLLGDEKKSQYNNRVYMGVCAICENLAEETHHIKYQKDADSNGFIDHIHKNNRSNLVPLCKACHKKETYGKINILGWVDTTDGKKLKVTRGENTNIIDFTYNSIPTNKIIYEEIDNVNSINSINNRDGGQTQNNSKVKGFKNLTQEQYDYILKSFEKYPNLKIKDLLFNINDECSIEGFKCTSHILRKIKKNLIGII